MSCLGPRSGMMDWYIQCRAGPGMARRPTQRGGGGGGGARSAQRRQGWCKGGKALDGRWRRRDGREGSEARDGHRGGEAGVERRR